MLNLSGNRVYRSIILAALFLSGSVVGHGAIYTYYINADNLATLTTGTFAGLANPNHNRLTFLYAHKFPIVPATPGGPDATVNHFHSIGSYRYSGSALSPTIIFGNNRIPEGTRPALPLQSGTGPFSGKLVSTQISDPNIGPYSDITIAPMSQLRAYHENGIPNEPEDYMYFGFNNTMTGINTTASNQRFSTTDISNAHVHLKLVDITDGLNIALADGTPIFDGGINDEYHLGYGSFPLFQPKFWTESSAAPGVYSATFKLVDVDDVYLDSGEFRFDFVVVPEPTTAALGLLGALVGWRRRRVV